MNKKELLDGIGNIAIAFGVIILVFAVIPWFVLGRVDKPPVERNSKADSIIVVNDSIKIKVKELDSIKHAEVIEVYSLDDDSTVKLFYKLVKE